MHVSLILIGLGVMVGVHGQMILQCRSTLPALFIVPHRTSMDEERGLVLDQGFNALLNVKRSPANQQGSARITLSDLEDNMLYEVNILLPGPRGKREVWIRSPTEMIAMFIGTAGPKGDKSYALKVVSEDGSFWVVRCVDKILYRYTIENESDRSNVATVNRIVLPSDKPTSYTISVRSPNIPGRNRLIALAMAMDELMA